MGGNWVTGMRPTTKAMTAKRRTQAAFRFHVPISRYTQAALVNTKKRWRS